MHQASAPIVPSRRHRRFPRRVILLYFWSILREFRWTLLLLLVAVSLGAVLYAMTPLEQLGNRSPSLLLSVYGAWMSLLAQPLVNPPPNWYLDLMCAVYPIFGALLIGEGVVRFALLMVSRRHGEKEWMRVMASTYRDHIVLCGLGHLGYRVLEQLMAADIPVVAVEKDEQGRFVPAAKTCGIPVLIRDMKEDQALIDAGIVHARAVIIATNDDMANLEVALDSRRLNPEIRIIMRLFDQQIASKIAGALTIDAAFSASALAAPIVAALSLQTRVLSSTLINGRPHVTAELTIEPESGWVGQRIEELETHHAMRILARTPRGGETESPPGMGAAVGVGDVLVIHTAAGNLSALAATASQTAGVAG